MIELLSTLRTQRKHRLREIVSIVILLSVSGCATSIIDTSCINFKPIYTSPADTEETLLQTDEHNAVYEKLCGES